MLSFRPPRNMGDGFTVMQSNDVEIYYYMDEAGRSIPSLLSYLVAARWNEMQ